MTEKYAGYYTLKKFIVYPEGGGKREYDLSLLIPAFTITESIDLDCINGYAKVIDSAGLLEGYPLRGEERIYIEVDDALGNNRVFHMFLWKIDNISVSDINKQLTYVIHFVSYQRFKASLKRVITAYDRPASEIALDLFINNYRLTRAANPSDDSAKVEIGYVEDEISKELVYEKVSDPMRITIPNMTPMQAMKFVAMRSFSNDSPSCTFRFFESANYFYFISDEGLYKKSEEANRIFNFTSTDIPKNQGLLNQQMSNFDSLNVIKRVDTISDLVDGTYRSKCYVLDINYGIYKEIDYNFTERRNLYYKDTTVPNDRHTDKFIADTFTPENSKKFYIVQTYDEQSAGSVAGNQNYPEIIGNRIGYSNHVQSLSVSASSPGRLDITCGDIIDLKVLKVIATDQIEENAQLSGKYIVRELNRVFKEEEYKNTYILMKKDWNVGTSS